MADATTRGDLRILLRLLRESRRYWPHVVGIFVIDLLATPLALLGPVPLKIAVDSVIGDQPIPAILAPLIPAAVAAEPLRLLVWVIVLLLVIEVITRVRALGSSLLRTYTGERLVMDFRIRLFRHSQRLSMMYHDKAGSADAIYRIQYDAGAIQNVTIDGTLPFITAIVTVVVMIYVTASISVPVALVAMAVVPALAVLTALFRSPLRHSWKTVKQLESSSLKIIQEVHSALRVVKAFGREDHEQRRFETQYHLGYKARVAVTLQQGILNVGTGLVTAGGMAGVMYIGVQGVVNGSLTLGSLLLIMSYMGQLYSPIKTLGGKVASMQKTLASAERAFELLDRDSDVVEAPNATPIQRARGHIEFRDVGFRYEEESAVLTSVNLVVQEGEKIGVVGRTGAGKSTLIGLVTRLFDPQEGMILLDGKDLRSYRIADLRNQFAMVLQETVLFSTSIFENIAYARPDATEEDVIRAAQAASADGFIAALPEGYDTIVGERGMRLSGGERQRIALARAFLKDAPILIFDEPTSSVDVGTEKLIMDSMNRLMEGRTTFMVAHRLSTLAACDRVIEVDHGTVQSAAVAHLA